MAVKSGYRAEFVIMYNNSADDTSTILVTFCAQQRRSIVDTRREANLAIGLRQALDERKSRHVLIAHAGKILDPLTIELPRDIRETASETQNAVY